MAKLVVEVDDWHRDENRVRSFEFPGDAEFGPDEKGQLKIGNGSRCIAIFSAGSWDRVSVKEDNE